MGECGSGLKARSAQRGCRLSLDRHARSDSRGALHPAGEQAGSSSPCLVGFRRHRGLHLGLHQGVSPGAALGRLLRHNVPVSHDLIDTAEMYLRTVYELREEGIVPMRARIAERLGQSNPTVSQTVARLQRDGLLVVAEDDRHLELTPEGLRIATAVMRKHRLAERLLTDILGLKLADVHEEACRWEHVISDTVERRLIEILETPTVSPFGNPIPGLAELLGHDTAATFTDVVGDDSVQTLRRLCALGARQARVVRISENVQHSLSALESLLSIGALPGAELGIAADGEDVVVSVDGAQATLPMAVADGIWAQPL